MKQSDIFLQGEGQAWYERNKDKLPPKHDPVMEIIEKAGIVPNNVLEVGCGDGWRLLALKNLYKCQIVGIDPANKIWEEPPEKRFPLFPKTADNLSIIPNQEIDLLIYGFCLYLVDREDLFRVVAEGDRVLKDGGYLIIHDFCGSIPFKRKYEHRDGIFSYHMDYSELWLANPAYSLYGVATNDPPDEVGAIMLKKDIQEGWPLEE